MGNAHAICGVYVVSGFTIPSVETSVTVNMNMACGSDLWCWAQIFFFFPAIVIAITWVGYCLYLSSLKDEETVETKPEKVET